MATQEQTISGHPGGGWRVIYVEEPIGTEAHVVPIGQEHRAGVACWCQPTFEPSSVFGPLGGRVWLHRRSHDHGHRYTDAEG